MNRARGVRILSLAFVAPLGLIITGLLVSSVVPDVDLPLVFVLASLGFVVCLVFFLLALLAEVCGRNKLLAFVFGLIFYFLGPNLLRLAELL